MVSRRGGKAKVRILQADGNLLLHQHQLPEATMRDLMEELTYNRKIHIRGREAMLVGANIRLQPVSVFVLEKDPDELMAAQMLVPEGYLRLVVKTLRRHGHEVAVVNGSTHGRASKMKPVWSQVKDAKWRHGQKEMLKLMLQHPIGRFGCPTGFGKSWLIGQFCRLLPKAKIDVTTTSADVIRQLYEYLMEIGIASVGLVGAGKRIYDRRVTCYCAKSLHHSRKDADIFIADEVHELATDKFLEQLVGYNRAKRFGFSASLDKREDGADFELVGVFGPVLYSMSYEDAVKHGCVVPMRVVWNPVHIRGYRGYDNLLDRERFGIWRNEERNKLVARRARFYARHKDQVLVTVSKIEHAMHLKKHLPDFTLCYGDLDAEDRRRYIREGLIPESQPMMTLERRFMLTKAFRTGRLRKVIATGVWNRGVDFRKLAVLIRADAAASRIADIQVPGRLSRTAAEAGKEVGILEDFEDQFDRSLCRRAKKRRESYNECKWAQSSLSAKDSRSALARSYLV